MRAMILAAGRGERMRPLTDTVPKPLLKIGKHALIEYHLMNLATAGFCDVVINVAYCAEQIQQALGNGSRYGVNIHYSIEEGAGLETGGGIYRALPLLGDAPFLTINADIWTDYPLHKVNKNLTGLAHVVLVDNPPQHPKGDYCLVDGYVKTTGASRLTFAGINVYHPALFADCKDGVFRVPSLLTAPMELNQVTGEHYRRRWIDVGTIERLEQARALYGNNDLNFRV